jgi:hypothetical protein
LLDILWSLKSALNGWRLNLNRWESSGLQWGCELGANLTL